MARINFGPLIAYDPTTGDLVKNGTGQVFDVTDTTYSNPIPVFDLGGAALAGNNLVSSSIGLLDEFQVDDLLELNWKSGSYVVRLTSFSGLKAIAEEAVATANSALAAAASATDAAASAASDAQAASTAAASAAAAAAAAAQAAQEGGGTGSGLSTDALNTYLGGNAQNLMDRVWGVREPTGVGTYQQRDADFKHQLSYGEGADPADLTDFDIHERITQQEG